MGFCAIRRTIWSILSRARHRGIDIGRDPQATREELVWLGAILLLGATIRLVALWLASDTPLVADEFLYYSKAVSLSGSGPIGDTGDRAPGAIFFYAGLFSLASPSLLVARLGNVALGTATIPLCWLLARRFGTRNAGLWAAGLAALYPTLVAFSHFVWTETLYIFLAFGALALLASALERPSLAKAGAAGVLLGAAALTRETGLAFPFVASGFLAWRWRNEPRRAARFAAVLLTAFAFTLLPWTVHKSREAGALILVSQVTWYAVFVGNAANWRPTGAARDSPHAEYRALGSDRTAREREARRVALDRIVEGLPGWPLYKVREQLPRFVAPTSVTARRLRALPEADGASKWAYDFRWDAANRAGFRKGLIALDLAAYLFVAFSGTAGLVLARRRPLAQLLILWVAVHLAPALVAFATTRFRLPCMPALIVASGALLPEARALWSAASTGRRFVAVAALTALALAMAAAGDQAL